MTHTFYIDAIGVNSRQLAKLFSVFYGIHPQIHIVTKPTSVILNPTNIGLLIWNGMMFMSKNIVRTAFVHRQTCSSFGLPVSRGCANIPSY